MTPRPVRFDHDAAEEAANQLLVTAESLVEALSVLEADREVVTEDWQGRFRTTFDHELGSTVLGGSFLAGTLQQMAAVIRARALQAKAAQALYEQWLQDQEDPGVGGR